MMATHADLQTCHSLQETAKALVISELKSEQREAITGHIIEYFLSVVLAQLLNFRWDYYQVWIIINTIHSKKMHGCCEYVSGEHKHEKIITNIKVILWFISHIAAQICCNSICTPNSVSYLHKHVQSAPRLVAFD